MAAAAPLPPRERLIAEGASARIFASRDAAGRPAALKLSRNAACDAALLAEADAAARFSHPGLLPVLAHGHDDAGRVWLLLPLLSGRTLASWQPALPDLLDALGPVADALDLLHDAGVGHGDIKPANVLLRDAGERVELLLGDLGLISPLGHPAPGGSPAYLSPQRLDGQPLSWQDDLHAIAVLIYETLAGRLPWLSEAGETLLRDIRTGRVVPLRARRPELPGELDDFLAITLRGGRRDVSVMGWLDALRELFGMRGLPRCLFLRPSGATEANIGTREALAGWLQEHLHSATSAHVQAGHEELRTIEELVRGDLPRLLRILDVLLKDQVLQDHAGQATFTHEPAAVGARLRERLLTEEPHDTATIAGWAGLLSALPLSVSRKELVASLSLAPAELEALLADLLRRRLLKLDESGRFVGTASTDFEDLVGRSAPLPAELFNALWHQGEPRPGARLQLLGLAQATGAEALLSIPRQEELLDLVEKAPGEVCDGLRRFFRHSSRGGAAECLLGMLDVVRLLRTDNLDAALERYWTFDRQLDPLVNSALNRSLVYQLTDSGRLREAQAFLQRWRKRHGTRISGTPLEIQIAAREIGVLSAYGAQIEATALAGEYLTRFAGREGAWVLHMALANLFHDRGDLREKLAQAEAALQGLEAERGPASMELDLVTFLAGGIIQASDRARWSRLPALLDRADALATSLEIFSISHRIGVARALQFMHKGDLREAARHLQMTRHSAERSGELKRAHFIDSSLFTVAREAGEYQNALLALPNLERMIQGSEGLQTSLNLREDVLRLQVAVGDLAAALVGTEAALGIADEASCILLVGLLLGLRGRLMALLDRGEEAIIDLGRAINQLGLACDHRDRNYYQLELIAVDPETDTDGALIAAVIDHEEAVGERRLLPRAWQLEARRLRRAGAIRDAALALEEAFRVAGTLVSPEHRWPLHVEAAELALAAGERDAARADLERAVAILHDLSLQFTDVAVRDRFLARPDRRAVLARLRALNAQ